MNLTKYSSREIESKIENCPQLASLRSISQALGSLLSAESSFSSQIAEVIRRDPSLTTRILKLVNSVFFGLKKPVTSIEECILYLGVRQIKELSIATPIIENFSVLNKNSLVNWNNLWRHSIGTAILTREILSIANVTCQDDSDYIMGLLHNVGKLVMAFAFPENFENIVKMSFDSSMAVCEYERNILGWDHQQVGAYYLKIHKLPNFIQEAVQFHHEPAKAPQFQKFSAAIQIADQMMQFLGFNGSEKVKPVKRDSWLTLDGWELLFGTEQTECAFGIASINHSLDRLPSILYRMV